MGAWWGAGPLPASQPPSTALPCTVWHRGPRARNTLWNPQGPVLWGGASLHSSEGSGLCGPGVSPTSDMKLYSVFRI